MNKDEALRLALEALLEYQDHLRGQAIDAIKQALAQEKALQALHNENERLGLYKDAYGQPEPEPVGQIIDQYNNANTGSSPPTPMPIWFNQLPPIGSKLYTSPPQRKPLTDEEIILIVAECASSHQHTDIHFARAIEAAHGIKELV